MCDWEPTAKSMLSFSKARHTVSAGYFSVMVLFYKTHRTINYYFIKKENMPRNREEVHLASTWTMAMGLIPTTDSYFLSSINHTWLFIIKTGLHEFAERCPLGFHLNMGIARVQARVAGKNLGGLLSCYEPPDSPGPDLTVGGWLAALCQK